jgi:hydrogenase nickel incorporation protein HypA/HybF
VHEAALFRDLHRALARLAREHPQDRIVRATVRIGPLGHVAPAALRSEWATITRGTGADGAELVVETTDDVADAAAGGLLLASVALATPPSARPNAEERPEGAD